MTFCIHSVHGVFHGNLLFNLSLYNHGIGKTAMIEWPTTIKPGRGCYNVSECQVAVVGRFMAAGGKEHASVGCTLESNTTSSL